MMTNAFGARWVAAACAGLVLASAAPASAAGTGRLVVQKGIHGVRLGMTQAQVKATAGTPRKVERTTTELGSSTIYRYRTYSVTFFNGTRVSQVDTQSLAERTTNGIGVGSSRAAVAAKVPGAKCVKEIGYDHCYVGTWKAGSKITDFAVGAGGRVWRVAIGYVID
jgi:hypothetical protein